MTHYYNPDETLFYTILDIVENDRRTAYTSRWVQGHEWTGVYHIPLQELTIPIHTSDSFSPKDLDSVAQRLKDYGFHSAVLTPSFIGVDVVIQRFLSVQVNNY